MRHRMIANIALFGAVFLSGSQSSLAAAQTPDLSEAMRNSIVSLEISAHGYEVSEPWKRRKLSTKWACGSAVGPYQVVTTARSVANHVFVKALVYGQNEYAGARVSVVDYESDLCLIKLDPNALDKPLKPLEFTDRYEKGEELASYWLSSSGRIYRGRGYLDRARTERARTSYGRRLRYIATGTSRSTGRGEIYFNAAQPIGIACWAGEDSEAGVIPGRTINRFLQIAHEAEYKGFGAVGFAVSELVDPARRAFLRLPDSIKGGAVVRDVYTLGTGSDVLQKDDVILGIDGHTLDAFGRYTHPTYELLAFDHLISSKTAGRTVSFDLWRDGERVALDVEVKNFTAAEMLVPYQEFDRQPEYIVTAGFVLQKLTREYLMEFGDNWAGESPPHLYHYYRDLAFKPGPERQDVVILSYVLPAPINLGYIGLGQIVVKEFNGMPIHSIGDIPTAQKRNPDSAYDVITFEMDNPAVVIPRKQLPAADAIIRKNYAVGKLSNINP